MGMAMSGEAYEKSMDWVERRIGKERARMLVRVLTGLTALGYGMAVLELLLCRDRRIWPVLLVPAAGFILVSVMRNLYSAPRPYQVYGFTPILEKDTKGKSFPSRHVFSNAIIGMAVLSVDIPLGIVLLAAGFLLAVLRVMMGVHFPKDVIAGAGIGILAGLIGFYII